MLSTPPLSALLLEPDPLQRDLIRLVLMRLGLNVTCIAQGEEAEAQLRQSPPTLFLVDLFLPQQNGLDLLADLAGEGLLKRSHLIVISAMAFPEIVQQAIQLGAGDFWTRPVDADLMASKIVKILKIA